MIVVREEVTPATLQAMLHFLYTDQMGEGGADVNLALDLLPLAEQYQLLRLKVRPPTHPSPEPLEPDSSRGGEGGGARESRLCL